MSHTSRMHALQMRGKMNACITDCNQRIVGLKMPLRGWFDAHTRARARTHARTHAHTHTHTKTQKHTHTLAFPHIHICTPALLHPSTTQPQQPWVVVKVYGLWFMVYGLWFMVYGLWFMVYGLWFMVYGLWFMVYGLGLSFRVEVRCSVGVHT